MPSHNILADTVSPIVADTSVLINLNATNYFRDILNSLPIKMLVTEQVINELKQGRCTNTDADDVAKIISDGLISIVHLRYPELQYFENLVLGPAYTTLGDGEAATIAYAYNNGMVALLDDRKANNICTRRFPGLQVACTVDVLTCPGVKATLGGKGLQKAILNALLEARMHVLEQHWELIIGIIGEECANSCVSLTKALRLRKCAKD